MWKRLLRLISPFSEIAKELAVLRELYELELASRNPPIIRITEKPGKDDTVVSYMDDAPAKPKSAMLRSLLTGVAAEDEDEDVFS